MAMYSPLSRRPTDVVSESNESLVNTTKDGAIVRDPLGFQGLLLSQSKGPAVRVTADSDRVLLTASKADFTR
jgi:hypothetical protein